MRQAQARKPALLQAEAVTSVRGNAAFADNRDSHAAQRDLAALIGKRTLAQRRSLHGVSGDIVQRVRAKPADDALTLALAGHVSRQRGTCCAKAADVRNFLANYADSAAETGAALLMWVEDDMVTGNHTAATIQWTEGTYVVDTTIGQFGGSDVFIGTLDAWQARVTQAQDGQVSNVRREAMAKPLGDSEMATHTAAYGDPFTAQARKAAKDREARERAEKTVAEYKARKATEGGKDTEEPAKKGCCFLTTACVEQRGLPDDCRELSVLRAFRDGYLRAQPEGPALIADYYRCAPGLVTAIGKAPDAARILEAIYHEVTLCVADIDDDDPASALARYRRMVELLLARFPVQIA